VHTTITTHIVSSAHAREYERWNRGRNSNVNSDI